MALRVIHCAPPSSSTPRCYTTAEAATVTRHKPQTYRRAYHLDGHFHGVKPAKIPGGRLLWPADQIDALARGEVLTTMGHGGQ